MKQLNDSSISSLDDYDQCVYSPTPFTQQRFWLVTVTGSTVAAISFAQNLFLFIVLASRCSHWRSYQLYPILLAFFDVLVAIAYIPLMSVSHLADYLLSPLLLRAWYSYMVPTITVSHIAITSSSYLILAATIERYCLTVSPQRVNCLNRHRAHIAALAVLLGVLTKSSLAIEYHIKHYDECESTMAEFALELSAIASDPLYNLLWRLWFRNILTILLPFFLLAFMNAQIVIVLQRTNDNSNLAHVNITSEKQRKGRVRAATRTLVFVVFTYLLSNVFNVIITFWEYIDIDKLINDYTCFYIYSTDLVSLLTITAGVLRLWIYVTCQKQLRAEFLTAANKLLRLPIKFKELIRSISDSFAELEVSEKCNDGQKRTIVIVAQCKQITAKQSFDEIFL